MPVIRIQTYEPLITIFMNTLTRKVELINRLLMNHKKAKIMSMNSKREAKNFLLESIREVSDFCNTERVRNARSFNRTLDAVYSVIIDFYNSHEHSLIEVEDVRKITELYISDSLSLSVYEFEIEVSNLNTVIHENKTVSREVVIDNVKHYISVSKKIFGNKKAFELLMTIDDKEVEHAVQSFSSGIATIVSRARFLYRNILMDRSKYEQYEQDSLKLEGDLKSCLNLSDENSGVVRRFTVHSNVHVINVSINSSYDDVEFTYTINQEVKKKMVAKLRSTEIVDIIDTFLLIYSNLYRSQLPRIKVMKDVDTIDQDIDELTEKDSIFDEVEKFSKEIRSLHGSNFNANRVISVNGQTHALVVKRSNDMFEYKYNINNSSVTVNVADVGTLECDDLIQKVIYTYNTLLKKKSSDMTNVLTRSEHVSKILVESAREIPIDSKSYKLLHLALTSFLTPSTQKQFIDAAYDRGLI